MTHEGDKFWYYFLYDEHKRPRLTVCLMWDHMKRQFHRGISLCSLVDVKTQHFNKKVGRVIAWNRARQASGMFAEANSRQTLCETRLTDYHFKAVSLFFNGDLRKIVPNATLLPNERTILYCWGEKQRARGAKIDDAKVKFPDAIIPIRSQVYHPPMPPSLGRDTVVLPEKQITATIKFKSCREPLADFFYYG